MGFEKMRPMVGELAHTFGELREESGGAAEGPGASRRGFAVSSAAPPEWVRGPARVSDDESEIVLNKDRAQRYRLQDRDCRELLFDLAGIGATGDIVRNARAFVRRYGLLWHGPSDLDGECREPLKVGWFRHIQDLHLTMALYRELKESARTGSSERLGRWLTTAVSRHHAERITAEGPRRFAHRLVANTITKGLEGCGVGVGPNVDLGDDSELGTFALSFLTPNLLGVAWAELAMLVGTGAEIKTCLGCWRSFSPVSGKQKYHSSACSNDNRQRRWKEKQA